LPYSPVLFQQSWEVDMGNQSEVVWIKQQIVAEQQSAYRALSSFAYGSAQHRFITRRMERMGALHDALKAMIGEDQAAQILIEGMEDK
jgi:hypothetical protein